MYRYQHIVAVSFPGPGAPCHRPAITLARSQTRTQTIVDLLAPFGLPGRGAGAGAGPDADDWTKTGTRLFHDIPSRSANSVLTPENERRSSTHCACGSASAMNCGRGSNKRMNVMDGWVDEKDKLAHRCRNERS